MRGSATSSALEPFARTIVGCAARHQRRRRAAVRRARQPRLPARRRVCRGHRRDAAARADARRPRRHEDAADRTATSSAPTTSNTSAIAALIARPAPPAPAAPPAVLRPALDRAWLRRKSRAATARKPESILDVNAGAVERCVSPLRRRADDPRPHASSCAARHVVDGTTARARRAGRLGRSRPLSRNRRTGRAHARNHRMTPEIFSAAWFSALASIVVIDLILAGDNALVIGLAARNVRRRCSARVILWGTVGAIIVRALLTAVVVWLLKIPASCWSAAWRSSTSAGSSRTTAAQGRSDRSREVVGARRRADDHHRRRRHGRRQRARRRRRRARLAVAGADRARRVDPDRRSGARRSC